MQYRADYDPTKTEEDSPTAATPDLSKVIPKIARRALRDDARRRWCGTRIATEFADPDKAFDRLWRHLMTPESQSRSYEELGDELRQMAERAESYTISDVKYRLATVLKAIRLATIAYIRSNRDDLRQRGVDPAKAEETASFLYRSLRSSARLINGPSGAAAQRRKLSQDVHDWARGQWLRGPLARGLKRAAAVWRVVFSHAMSRGANRPTASLARCVSRIAGYKLNRKSVETLLISVREQCCRGACRVISR